MPLAAAINRYDPIMVDSTDLLDKPAHTGNRIGESSRFMRAGPAGTGGGAVCRRLKLVTGGMFTLLLGDPQDRARG